SSSAFGRWAMLENGPTVRLVASSGRMEVSVHKLTAGQRFLIMLPDGELEVKGTRFVVVLEDHRTTELEVREGRVALRLYGQREVMLASGERWPVKTVDVPLPPPGPPVAAPATPRPATRPTAVTATPAAPATDRTLDDALAAFEAGDCSRA